MNRNNKLIYKIKYRPPTNKTDLCTKTSAFVSMSACTTAHL